jgi:hypothetical protein
MNTGQNLTPYIITVGVLIVVVIVAGLVLVALRARLNGADEQGEMGAGGMLETMRAMRDRGEISEEEYRTAQAALVARAGRERGENSGADQAGGPGPARARTRAPSPGELVARPGYDLTGEPLPPPVRDSGGENRPDSRRV